MNAVIFKSEKNGQYYFHLVARNGKSVAASEGYKRKASAVKTLKSIQNKGFSICVMQ